VSTEIVRKRERSIIVKPDACAVQSKSGLVQEGLELRRIPSVTGNVLQQPDMVHMMTGVHSRFE
jgi:hypothetical protein